MSRWSEHVKKYAKKHKMSYQQANKNDKCKEAYQKKKKRMSPKKKKTSPVKRRLNMERSGYPELPMNEIQIEAAKVARSKTNKYMDDIRNNNYQFERDELHKSGCNRKDNYHSCYNKIYIYEMVNKGFSPDGLQLTGSTKTY